MTLLPVLERELRSASRQPFTYTLRLFGCGGMLAIFSYFFVTRGVEPGSGGELFMRFHVALFWAIWVLAPLLTADTISRERREGTLVLLALTPLTAQNVIVAKAFANALRALTLWLVVLPILSVSILIGGVDWQMLALSLLISFNSLCLATAAGILASALSRAFVRAAALSAFIAMVFLVIFLGCLGHGYIRAFNLTSPAWGTEVALWPTELGLQAALMPKPAWLPAATAGLFTAVAVVTVFSLCVAALALGIAGRVVKRAWKGEQRHRAVTWLEQRLCRPVFFTAFLKTWLSRQLQRSPIAWLEQRSWSGRLVAWSWLAVIIAVYTYLLTDGYMFRRGLQYVQVWIGWMLAASIGISSAGSFRRERDNGVLELLLVAPLTEWELIGGRLRGLWMQFVPAIVLLFSAWLYLSTFTSVRADAMLLLLLLFSAVPVIGLFFSLVLPSFAAALTSTLLTGIVVPVALLNTGLPQAIVFLLVIAFAAGLGWNLHARLSSRQFTFR